MSRQMRHYYKFGPFRLDPAKRDLLRDGEIVPLPPQSSRPPAGAGREQRRDRREGRIDEQSLARQLCRGG